VSLGIELFLLTSLDAATSTPLPVLIANKDSLLKTDPSAKIARQDTLQSLQVRLCNALSSLAHSNCNSICTGSQQCSSCPAGKFSDKNASLTCNPCSSGKFSLPASSVCYACKPGSIANADNSGCLKCAPGSYSRYKNKVLVTLPDLRF